jgi:hypothetical protein
MSDSELDETIDRYFTLMYDGAKRIGAREGIQSAQLACLNAAFQCALLDKLIARIEELRETMRDIHRSLKNSAPVEP